MTLTFSLLSRRVKQMTHDSLHRDDLRHLGGGRFGGALFEAETFWRVMVDYAAK